MRQIVIMEDEPDVAMLLARRFSAEGFQVATASDERAGLMGLPQRLSSRIHVPVIELSYSRLILRSRQGTVPGKPGAHMRPLFNAILFLAWISAYLIAISWVARYRKTQVHALGPTRYTDYRTDKDMGLRLAILIVGAALLLVAYLATHMVGRYF